MLTLPGGARVPIGVRRVTSVAYTVSNEKYTPEEAMEIAYYRLERMIGAELPNAQLLHKKIETEIGESAYILLCTVKCVEDIAEVAEFDAELS